MLSLTSSSGIWCHSFFIRLFGSCQDQWFLRPYPSNCHKLHLSKSLNHDFYPHKDLHGIGGLKYRLYSFQIGEGDKLINVVLLNGERLNVRVQVKLGLKCSSRQPLTIPLELNWYFPISGFRHWTRLVQHHHWSSRTYRDNVLWSYDHKRWVLSHIAPATFSVMRDIMPEWIAWLLLSRGCLNPLANQKAASASASLSS